MVSVSLQDMPRNGSSVFLNYLCRKYSLSAAPYINLIFKWTVTLFSAPSVSDRYSLNPDQDPCFLVNPYPDPDPGFLVNLCPDPDLDFRLKKTLSELLLYIC